MLRTWSVTSSSRSAMARGGGPGRTRGCSAPARGTRSFVTRKVTSSRAPRSWSPTEEALAAGVRADEALAGDLFGGRPFVFCDAREDEGIDAAAFRGADRCERRAVDAGHRGLVVGGDVGGANDPH